MNHYVLKDNLVTEQVKGVKEAQRTPVSKQSPPKKERDKTNLIVLWIDSLRHSFYTSLFVNVFFH